MGGDIAKEETYNKYGDASRGIGIGGRLRNMGLCWGPFFWVSRRGSLIGGIFVSAVGNKPIPAGQTKTGAYVDENRKLEDRYCAKGYLEFAGANASAPSGTITEH